MAESSEGAGPQFVPAWRQAVSVHPPRRPQQPACPPPRVPLRAAPRPQQRDVSRSPRGSEPNTMIEYMQTTYKVGQSRNREDTEHYQRRLKRKMRRRRRRRGGCRRGRRSARGRRVRRTLAEAAAMTGTWATAYPSGRLLPPAKKHASVCPFPFSLVSS